MCLPDYKESIDNSMDYLFSDLTIDILYYSKGLSYYTFSIEYYLKKQKCLIDRSLNEFLSYGKYSIRTPSNRVYFICG